MKLSLAWIFDHIEANWQEIDVDKLVAQFNKSTAEVEDYYRVSYDMTTFFAGIKQNSNESVVIPELDQEVVVGQRTNAIDIISTDADKVVYLLKKEKDSFRWATLADFGVDKDGLLPALDINDFDIAGNWRQYFEHDDVMLEVDNKSVTHRPDMWGHRGFAREIAAFMELAFKPKGDFLSGHRVVNFDKHSQASNTNPFTIDIKTDDCYKFNGLFIPSIENKPSNVFIVSRLLKIGSRPINGIVDLTNYVAFDWSQPVHAYDAAKVVNKEVVIRRAQPLETLTLLDGSELQLTEEDMVVADGEKPMCLAGVKGGFHDSVSAQTTSLFFESANFDASSVRKAALRHRVRTDSSARFEKTLDRNQAIEGVLRFIDLAEQCGIKMALSDEIVSVGKDVVSPMLRVSHQFLENKLGQKLDQTTVVNLLKRLEFEIKVDKQDGDDNQAYLVNIPTFRASKDVKIQEDILEEVARMYGFEKIKLELPKIHRTPFDMTKTMRMRKIRDYLAYTAHMIEQQNYALYDEQFLLSLNIELPSAACLINPVSENNRRLVSSLVPGLLKNIAENLVHKDFLYFFELAKVWMAQEGEQPVKESYQVSGIFFEKRKEYNFYDGKNVITSLLSMLGFDIQLLEWRKTMNPTCYWCTPYKSVTLYYDGQYIGYAGIMLKTFLQKLPVLPESTAFVFELDADFLLNASVPDKTFIPFSRYQETYFDLSLLTPLAVTTNTLQQALQQVSLLITSVELIDFFEKKDWEDVRSLTFRIWINNKEKTLEKEEIDAVWKQAINVVSKLGAQVRSQE